MGNCSNQSGTGIWLQRESGETNHRISIFAHNGDDYMDVPGTECLYDQWMHVVGVHDDTAQTITLYVNGKDCGTTELEAPVNFWTRFQGTSDKLVLGSNHDFGGGGGFVSVGALNGKIAYAKVYDKAVSAADVAELYAASGLQSGGSATENPGNNGGSATAAPTKTPNQPNAGTFDMGIVSFAAVALSSLVAVKKRK